MGTSITALGDSVDADGDGTAGVEPGDTVVETGPDSGATATVYTRTAGNASSGAIS